MVFEDVPGLNKISGIGDIDITRFLGKLGNIFLLLVLFALAAGIIGFWLYRKKEKALYSQNLHFFEEVNGQTVPTESLLAAELTIPGTSIMVFHVKSKDLFLPRGVIRMGKKSYWYSIRNNREIINFSMTNINKETGEAGLNYDHTDMRYAYTNLREIIKRNYKDKSQKWWREYKDVIATVIYIFVVSLSFFFIVSQIGKLLGQIDPLLGRAEEILAQLAKYDNACRGASGIA